jgi:hypothetical protein
VTFIGGSSRDASLSGSARDPSLGGERRCRSSGGGYVVNSGFVYAIESRVVLPNEYRLTLSYPPTINSENGADYSATIYCAKIK